MATFQQLVKNPRIPKIHKTRTVALQRCPQKKGSCIRIFIQTPRKPNSARRRVARIELVNRKRINAYIPGEGEHSLQPHSVVLVRGGRVKDLPGMKYKLIRGKYDFEAHKTRIIKRSKYGTPKVKS